MWFNRDVIKNDFSDWKYYFYEREHLISADINHFLKALTTTSLQNNTATEMNTFDDDDLTLPLYYVNVSQSPTQHVIFSKQDINPNKTLDR